MADIVRRFRFRGKIAVPITVDQVWGQNSTTCNDSAGDYQVGSSTWKQRQGVSESMSDHVVHKWKAVVARGEWIINPMHKISTEIRCYGGSYFRDVQKALSCSNPQRHASYYAQGAIFQRLWVNAKGQLTPTQPLGSRMTSVLEESWTACLAGRQRGSSNFVETLGELDQVYGMVANPLQNGIRFVDGFSSSHTMRRKNIYGFIDTIRGPWRERQIEMLLARFATSEWLRFRYGISPVISDVKAAMKALKKGYDKKDRIYCSKTAQQADSQVNTPFKLSYSPNREVTCHRVDTQYFSVISRWWDVYKKDIYDEVGLTLHNVVGASWEFTKFSFVYDWFVNVGDLIYANIPRVSLAGIGGCQTIHSDTTSVAAPLATTQLSSTLASWTCTGSFADYIVAKEKSKQRNPRFDHQGSLVIKDDFRLDGFHRAADAVSLLIQKLGKVSFH